MRLIERQQIWVDMLLKVLVFGFDNELKPSKEVKRMITNLFMEYNESGYVEHCSNEFVDI